MKKIITIPGSLCPKQATVYPALIPAKAAVLYFHGGGLLFGSREDLPAAHIQAMTGAGYTVIAFDYPLAPAVKLAGILADAADSTAFYQRKPEIFGCSTASGEALPWFLWGRSAGAYLCLMTAARLQTGAFALAAGNASGANSAQNSAAATARVSAVPGISGKAAGLSPTEDKTSGKNTGLNRTSAQGPEHPLPSGILSWYGYGFFTDGWFCTPSAYYRSLPPVDESCLSFLPKSAHTEGALDTHYSAYIYARQSGKWLSLIYEGREKFFYRDYTLRLCNGLPCPMFAAHATGDPDVPFAEFQEIVRRYDAQSFIAAEHAHDFDRLAGSPEAENLLRESVRFLDDCLQKQSS